VFAYYPALAVTTATSSPSRILALVDVLLSDVRDIPLAHSRWSPSLLS
jgi:hypothetical protein